MGKWMTGGREGKRMGMRCIGSFEQEINEQQDQRESSQDNPDMSGPVQHFAQHDAGQERQRKPEQRHVLLHSSQAGDQHRRAFAVLGISPAELVEQLALF